MDVDHVVETITTIGTGDTTVEAGTIMPIGTGDMTVDVESLTIPITVGDVGVMIATGIFLGISSGDIAIGTPIVM